jgi:predicted dehydrogenase
VVQALERGKHVFVEKPLALDEEQLENVARAAKDSPAVLMVGFNRRFAPLASRLVAAVGRAGPLVATYRVNAGRLPRSHWTHDPEVGGGRVVGEACHFVDFLSLLGGGSPTSVSASAVGGGSELREDNLTATLRYASGSLGVLTYTALGDPSLAKERVEVMGEAGAAILDDFRTLRLHRNGEEQRIDGQRNKGHAEEIATFLRACRSGRQPWPIEDMLGVTRATFDIRRALETSAAPIRV